MLAFSYKISTPENQFKECVYALIHSEEEIGRKIKGIPDSEPLGQYDMWCNAIRKVMDAFAAPRKCQSSESTLHGASGVRSHRTRPAAPWWNNDCAEATKRRKQVTQMFRREPSRINYELYRAELLSCRKTLKMAKKRGWQSYCETLGPFTSTGKVWNQIRRFKNRKLTKTHEFSLLYGNSTAYDPCINEVVDRICESFCSPSIPVDPAFNGTALTAWLVNPFVWEELQSALNLLKVKSSPGLDAIDNRILKALPESLLQLLLDIINRLFSNGLFPLAWRHSLVYLIPKPNNRGVRPIALTSCILKLVERMLLFRLQWHLESECKLPEFQFGFRKSRSCLDNLTNLTTDVFDGFVHGRVTAAIFIDIKSAFDSVLLKELQLLNLPSPVLQFINNLISIREVQFVLNGQLTNTRVSRKGTPQGAVLSPTLFNIYLGGIRSAIPAQISVLQFADDIVTIKPPRITRRRRIPCKGPSIHFRPISAALG